MPRIHSQIFVSLALASVAASWWGCASGSSSGSSASLSSSSGNGGGSAGGAGSGGLEVDGGDKDGGACTSTSKKAHPVPLDIVFLIDRSITMSGAKWTGVTAALKVFFNDPTSAAIGAGLVLFPYTTSDCDPTHYEILTVPIAPLPGNAFALSNALPADAAVYGTPLWGALKGSLSAATAYQDAHPAHKVNLVLATDGNNVGFDECTGHGSVDDIADLARSALGYDGVHTYVIGVQGTDIPTMNKIAAAGGTTAAYDVTQDISQFSAKMAEIRKAALGCDFEIPQPPHNKKLDPNLVNFSYTPMGMGKPKVLPRAHDLADCGHEPGWYYDDNSAPTEILLCPSSCTTVQNDSEAEVDVLFGCVSLVK